MRAGRARAVHLGRRRKPATRPRCGSSSRRTLARRERPRRSLRRPRVEALPEARAATGRPRRSCPGCAGASRSSERQGRPRRRRRRRCWSSSIRNAARRAGGARAPPAPTTSCAPRSGRWCCLRPGRRRRRATLDALARGVPRGLCRLLRALPASRLARPCATPTPVVYLVPGVGMLTFASDKATARIAAEFYVNAINVMRGADGVDSYVGPARAGSLRHRVLAARGGQAAAHAQAQGAGRAGGAGHRRRRRHRRGDGAAAAGRRRLRRADRHRRRGAGRGGAGFVQAASAATWCTRRSADVTDEAGGARPLWQHGRAFGGIDIVVANAGLATAPRPAETSLADWEKNMRRPGQGRVSWSRARRSRLMLAQKLGGSIVTIGSKNALAPRPAPRPTAPPRPPPSISPAASRSRARRTASAPTWSIPTRCCAARGSGAATGARRAPPAWASTKTSSRRPTASARCSSAASIPRTSPRPSFSCRRGARPSRPATSSTSMPATRSPSAVSRPEPQLDFRSARFGRCCSPARGWRPRSGR